jgi:1-deoxy-D-xylulose 5-phosphate reductoisomerase
LFDACRAHAGGAIDGENVFNRLRRPQIAACQRFGRNCGDIKETDLTEEKRFHSDLVRRVEDCRALSRALALAQEALRAGGARPAILNAANEIAVKAFLLGEIGFLDIAAIAAETLTCCDLRPPQTVEDVLAVDRAARVSATGIKQRFVQ